MNALLNSNNEISDNSAAKYENTGSLNTECTNIIIIYFIFLGIADLSYVHLLNITYADALWEKTSIVCTTLHVRLNCNLSV